jgi:TonB family protein
MPKNIRFWRNVTLIGLAHVALITGLVRWSRETKTIPQSVVWMNGGAGEGAASPAKPAPPPKPKKISTPAPERKPEVREEPEEDRPVLTSAKSDIQLPAATPKPSPSASPRVKVTPKPRPKATPTPTPKPKASPKKIVLAKASPKPSPKVKPTPAEKEEDADAKAEAMKKEIAKAKAVLEKSDSDDTPTDATDKPIKKAIATQAGTGKGTSSGGGGHAGGAGGESQFGWYGSMLHDRFYSEWVQPTTIATTAKISALVKIRIEKDGRVSSFDIIKPSGNAVVDESVGAVAKRVTQVEALPAGLGNGEHYDVKINFELNSEQ